jgi:hypothetical protein
MSGIIQYAEVKYWCKSNKADKPVFKSATMIKRKKQSDEKFVKDIKKFLKKNTIKGFIHKQVSLQKPGIKFFDSQENEVYV